MTAEDGFEQGFMANVRRVDDGPAELSSGKKARNWVVIVVIAVVILVIVLTIIISFFLIGDNRDDSIDDSEDTSNSLFDAEKSMLEIMVAPSSAKVLIGGQQYANGEYEVMPGEYDVSIEAEGFESYNGKIIVADKHKSYVTECLQPLEGKENYYNSNAVDYQTCQSIEELKFAVVGDQNILVDDIFKYTPYHNHEDGYYVDPYFDESGNVVVELTFKDCSQTETVLEGRAYKWMEEQGLNPSDYTFEKTWDCEE